MKKQKEGGKYIHASFIGKVSLRRKEYIKYCTVGKEKNIPNHIYTPTFILDNFKLWRSWYEQKEKRVYIIKKFMLITY